MRLTKLPVVLLSDGKQVQILLSAAELNQYKSLEELVAAIQEKVE